MWQFSRTRARRAWVAAAMLALAVTALAAWASPTLSLRFWSWVEHDNVHDFVPLALPALGLLASVLAIIVHARRSEGRTHEEAELDLFDDPESRRLRTQPCAARTRARIVVLSASAPAGTLSPASAVEAFGSGRERPPR